ncbi:MAG: hypothetical protein N2Z74_10025, partial [Syntrophales bacterium]|nr:hypothetical protein [Syntrophales bacterium]
TELFTDPDRVEYVIVGLGLNVNIPREGFPPELRPTATSILAEAGMRAGRAEIVRRYLEVLEKSYLSLATGGLPDIVHRWRTLVGLAGRRVHVDLWDTTLRGRVVAMDADGALVLRGDGGETHRLHAGDLQEEEDEP